MRPLVRLNTAVARNLQALEMVGVLMRIFSFSLVSWMGPSSPFLFVWVFNTIDAAILAWCAVIKKDKAYTVLNVFWIGVGIVGIVRATGSSALVRSVTGIWKDGVLAAAGPANCWTVGAACVAGIGGTYCLAAFPSTDGAACIIFGGWVGAGEKGLSGALGVAGCCFFFESGSVPGGGLKPGK